MIAKHQNLDSPWRVIMNGAKQVGQAPCLFFKVAQQN